jgi:type I restriction enzyme, R subunit
MSLPDYREKMSSQIPALQVFMALGYEYVNPYEALQLRDGKPKNVILTGVLEDWLHQHNRFSFKGETYAFDNAAIREAVRQLTEAALQGGQEGLVRANETLYELLTLGTSQPQTVAGDTRSFNIHFIDWEHPENNWYTVTEEFAVERRHSYDTRRPDIVCFVNGIPLVVIECKRPDKGGAGGGRSVEEGISQMLRNQGEDEIPHLFMYSQLLLAISKNDAQYATTGTPKRFWTVWKEEDHKAHELRTHTVRNHPLTAEQRAALYDWRDDAHWCRQQFDVDSERLPTEQDRTLVSLLDAARLLELIYQYIVFDGGQKKIARYQQYFAVKATLDRVAHLNAQGERTGGVIWHTTGSGKSLTMVMLAKALTLHPPIKSPRVILVTDRVNLDEQIYKTFQACGKSVVQAQSGKNLIELVQSREADIIATVINKFEAVAQEDITDDNPNVFVLVDESHRTQYGRIHSKMRQVFTRACYIGFTGTPLTSREKNTAAKFGSFIHKYPMRQAVDDQAVVPLLYEGRMVDLNVNRQQIDRWFARVTRDLTEEQQADLKRKMSRAEEVSQVDQRIQEIAYDLSEHYRKNFQGTGFKVQLATSSKAQALKYKHYLDEWGVVTSEVVISPPDTREGHEEVDELEEDEVQAFWAQIMKRYGGETAYNREVIADFAREDGVEVLIVVDKLLVGFDEPRNTVLYIDKSLRDHGILQAIARVNRLYEGKDFGYVVDYRGVLGELNEAMQTYDALADFDVEDVAGTITDVSAEIARLPQLHSDLWAVFRGVNTEDSEAMERFLEPEDIRQKFYDALEAYTRSLKAALSSVAFYEDEPEHRIRLYKRDMKFFHNLRMAVKLRYAEAIDYRDYEQKVRKLLDDHISADGMTQIAEPVDIFNRADFDRTLDQLGTPRARAEAILNRLKVTVIESLEQDPAFYRKFSQLIDDTLTELREGRIAEWDALDLAKDLREQVAEGHDSDLPNQLHRYKHAPAYYGVLHEVLSGDDLSDDVIADMAIQIEYIIEEHKIRDWRANQDVQKDMALAVEDYLYESRNDHNVALSWDDIDFITAQVVEIAKKRID